MLARNIMTKEPVRIDADGSLDDAMDLMDEHAVRHLPVLDGGRVVGLIGERDLLQATGWLPHGLREALEGPDGTVGDFMHAPAVTVAPEDGLARVAGVMIERGIGCVPVVLADQLVGIVSELDLLREFVEGRRAGRIPAAEDVPVSEAMTADPLTGTPDDALEDLVERMRSEGFRHLPIVEKGLLVGLISDRDVRRAVGEGRYGGTTARAYMNPETFQVGPDTPLSEAAARLLQERVGSLLVTSEGELVGIVTVADVLGACAVALQNAAARGGKSA